MYSGLARRGKQQRGGSSGEQQQKRHRQAQRACLDGSCDTQFPFLSSDPKPTADGVVADFNLRADRANDARRRPASEMFRRSQSQFRPTHYSTYELDELDFGQASTPLPPKPAVAAILGPLVERESWVPDARSRGRVAPAATAAHGPFLRLDLIDVLVPQTKAGRKKSERGGRTGFPIPSHFHIPTLAPPPAQSPPWPFSLALFQSCACAYRSPRPVQVDRSKAATDFPLTRGCTRRHTCGLRLVRLDRCAAYPPNPVQSDSPVELLTPRRRRLSLMCWQDPRA